MVDNANFITSRLLAMKEVTVYSRSGCHLCEIAIDRLNSVIDDYKFTLNVVLIDNNSELEKEFGEQVPVILINNKIHDYWRVDLERFTTAIKS
jgi:glutaredoxin